MDYATVEKNGHWGHPLIVPAKPWEIEVAPGEECTVKGLVKETIKGFTELFGRKRSPEEMVID